MKCDACKEREATVHESAIAAGKVVERHLCEACAAKQGVAPGAAGLSPEELAKKLLAAHKSAADAVASGKLRTHCRACNLPFATFREGGLLGCPDCYASFEPQLGPMLERYHEGGARHAGKSPRRAGAGALAPAAQQPAPPHPPAPDAPKGDAPRAPALPSRAERARQPDAPPGATTPAPAKKPDERAKRIAILNAQLADAIRKEQYEVAAQLRDALKALSDPPSGSAPPPKPRPERTDSAGGGEDA